MLVALVAALILGVVGLVSDKSKLLAGVSAAGSVLALILFTSAC